MVTISKQIALVLANMLSVAAASAQTESTFQLLQDGKAAFEQKNYVDSTKLFSKAEIQISVESKMPSFTAECASVDEDMTEKQKEELATFFDRLDSVSPFEAGKKAGCERAVRIATMGLKLDPQNVNLLHARGTYKVMLGEEQSGLEDCHQAHVLGLGQNHDYPCDKRRRERDLNRAKPIRAISIARHTNLDELS
jgi:hypothetical protein